MRGRDGSGSYVYILASKRNATLYVGVTNDLLRRTSEHKQGLSGWLHAQVWNNAAR